MRNKRYPKIFIRSKNELAKHISGKFLSKQKALVLINDVLTNFDYYWRDHRKSSSPDKGKWVRNASRTRLGRLLEKINTTVLKPHDNTLPSFIFGGVNGKNHKSAVEHLLGSKRKRILLKLDIKRFYEQIKYDRVVSFFVKSGCSKRGSNILAKLCCVPHGAKENPGDYLTIARGFSTSSRLAVWCNLDIFLRLEWLVKKELKGKDPRIAIYVDDIGITASKATKEDMLELYKKIKNLFKLKSILPINEDKTRIVYHFGQAYDGNGNNLGVLGFEHLGLQMKKNSLSPSMKSRWKLTQLKKDLQRTPKNSYARKRLKSALQYKEYIER